MGSAVGPAEEWRGRLHAAWLEEYRAEHPEATPPELIRAAFDAGQDAAWLDEGCRWNGPLPRWWKRVQEERGP